MKERACYSTTTHKGTRPASSNLQGTGALLEDPGPVVSLRFSSPQPLDPVAEQLTLLVVHELVAVAGFGFAQDRAPRLDADGPAEYPVSDHRRPPCGPDPRREEAPSRGSFLYPTLIKERRMVTLKELEDWLAPAEAGQVMGMSKQGAIKRLEQKTLRGVKTHQGWLVDPEDAERVARERHVDSVAYL